MPLIVAPLPRHRCAFAVCITPRYNTVFHTRIMKLALIDVLREEFAGYGTKGLRNDIMAGISVAAVALPVSLAFGIARGATAAAGISTAIVAGGVMGALSGTPNQVSGPTGAMSAVLLVVAKNHGLEGVWVTTLMAGAMTVLALAAAGILITSAVIAITGYQITAKIGILITIIPVSGTIVVIPIQRAHIPVIAPFLGIITQTALDTGVVTVAVPRGDLGGIGPANHVGATGIIISVVISGHRTLLIA